jgi:hypothetical protein
VLLRKEDSPPGFGPELSAEAPSQGGTHPNLIEPKKIYFFVQIFGQIGKQTVNLQHWK